ncbi:MAG: phosphodiester glycosidase family protein [Bacteroidota bacterium]
MKANRWILFIFTGLLILNLGCKSNKLPLQKTSDTSFEHTQIVTDSLYQSKQQINIIKLQSNPDDNYEIDFGYSNSALKTTSYFGKSEDALAAINGNFFNMDEGGSVSYLEINDSIINPSLDPDLKWGITDSIINGAIIIYKDEKVDIHPKRSGEFYYNSKKEKAVMFTGPLLIQNAKKSNLFDSKFVSDRHPRTCLCKTEESILFVTIDGRSANAQGMNLYELQDFLLNIGCLDAINLDGGGSTTMWIHNKGIVNHPSDKSGERPVANILLIRKKEENTP